MIACVSQAVDAPTAIAESDGKPNLIYIMADDLGYGDLGCFGQKVIQTPSLDKLAAEGLKLTSYYAGDTVCRPSRLVLWTGKHSGHTPIDSNANYVFKPADVTVAELLKKAGYATGGVGKWAMGGPGSTGQPAKNGFDFWMGYLDQSEAHNYYPTHLWRNGEKFPLKGNVIGDDPNGRGRVSSKRVTYSHDVMTDQMLEFIREHQAGPFLMHVHWTIPHANNEGGRAVKNGMEVPDYGIYADRDWPDVEKGQAAMITRMDKDVGRLIALLRELKIDQNTLVFFTSDNGPHNEGGHKHEYFDANGPLRGFKRDLYEGGIRTRQSHGGPEKSSPAAPATSRSPLTIGCPPPANSRASNHQRTSTASPSSPRSWGNRSRGTNICSGAMATRKPSAKTTGKPSSPAKTNPWNFMISTQTSASNTTSPANIRRSPRR